MKHADPVTADVLPRGPRFGRRGAGALLVLVTCGASLGVAFGSAPEIAFAFATVALLGMATTAYAFRLCGFPSISVATPLFYVAIAAVIPTAQQLSTSQDFLQLPGIISALYTISVGLGAYGTGLFFCTRLFGATGFSPALSERWPLRQVATPAACTVLLGIGVFAEFWSLHYGYFGLLVVETERQSSTAGAIGIATSLLDFVCIISLHRSIDNRGNRKAWILLATLSLLALLYGGVIGNSKWGVVKPLAYIGVAFTSIRQRLPTIFIGIFVAGYVLIAYPFISSLRDVSAARSWSATDALIEAPIYFFQMDWVHQARGDANVDSFSEGFGSLGRGLLPVIAHITDTAGTEHPLLHGETYALGFETVVPRFLWQEKPDLSVGNFIGQYFGFIYPGDNITNISPSQVGELFMNFGLIGVIVGMFAWGCATWTIDRRLVKQNTTWLATWSLFLIMWQEQPFGHGPVAFLKGLPLLIALFGIAGSINGLLKRRRQ